MKSGFGLNQTRVRRRAVVLLGAGMLACPAVSRAATYTWNGGDPTFGLLTEPDNWAGNSSCYSATAGTADLLFASTNPHGYSPTLSGNLDAHSLTFNTSALAYNIITNGSGFSGVLTLESAGLTDSASNAETISGSTAVLLNASQLWNVASGTFTDSTPLNLSSSTLTVNTANTTATANLTGTLSGSSSDELIKTGTGTLNLAGSGSALAAVSLSGGTTQISSGSLSISGLTLFQNSAVLNISGGAFSANAGLSGGGGTIKLTDPSGGTALTISDAVGSSFSTSVNISGTGSVQKNGSGYEGFAGTNTFTGQVVVNAGTLELASGTASAYNAAGGILILDIANNASGSTSLGGILTGPGSFGNVTIGAGGTFAPGPIYTGSSQNGSIGVITIRPGSTVSTYVNLTLDAPTTVNVSESTDQLTLVGTISGNGNTLTSIGAGTLILNGLGSSSTLGSLSIQAGATQILSGTLSLTSATNPLLVYEGATLTISNGATVYTSSGTSIVDGPAGTSLTVTTGTGNSPVSALEAYGLIVGNSSYGSLTVSNATLTLTQNLTIGSASGSNGTFILNNGGTASANDGFVAKAGSTGSVSVDGSSSVLTISGAGGLTIGGSSASTPGSVSITNYGSINVNAAVTFTGPDSSMNVNGGVLTAGSLKSGSAGYGSISLTDPTEGGYALVLDSASVGTVSYSGSISGTGSIYKTGASTQVLSGANTFTGFVLVEGGTLELGSGTANDYLASQGTLKLDFGSFGSSILESDTGATIIYNTRTIAGGTLLGAGTHNVSAVTLFEGTNITDGVSITVANSSTMTGGSNAGIINNPASSLFTWEGGSNAGGTFNVSGSSEVIGWTSSGVTLISAGGALFGYLDNVLLLGGSETYVGTSAAPGGALILTAGASLQLNGGLLVNYGNISGGTLDINYGGLATGTGSYSSVVVNPGGTYLPGNYGAGSPAVVLGSPLALIQPATNGSTSTTVPVTVTAGAQITVNAGSSLTLAGGLNASGQSVTLLGGGTAVVAPFSATSLNVSNGVVQISPSTGVLEIGSLTVGASSKLDLTSDAADISGGTLSAITALARQGYANGTWNGAGGIVSSTAAVNAKHLTAIGVIQNNQSGTAIYNSSHQFLNTTPGASDILLACTYYGDTNLDGKVDGSDYSRIDAASLADKTNPTAATGWFNGDFNYDGVINGSDYTLIDNAFNTQGAQLSAEIATPTAQLAGSAVASVPEPAGVGVFVIGTIGSLGRRMRRRYGSRSTNHPH